MGGGCYSVKAVKGKFSEAHYGGQMLYEPAISAAPIMEAKPYTLDDAHILRSRILDAFSRLERAIVDKARIAGIKVTRGTPISDYLNELGKKDFKSPVKAKQKIEAAQKLLYCRNDIVHSELEMTECTGTMAGTFFVFQNIALEQENCGRCVRMIDAEEFAGLPVRIKNLANELKQQQLKGEAQAVPEDATE